MQDVGMEIVDMRDISDGLQSQFISFPNAVPIVLHNAGCSRVLRMGLPRL